jgi:hypothetical protein
MISRREALLGVLLAPLIKPVASLMPKPVSSNTMYWSVLQDPLTFKGESYTMTMYDDPVIHPNRNGDYVFYQGKYWDGELWDYSGERAVCLNSDA